jgi:hypothetical protein
MALTFIPLSMLVGRIVIYLLVFLTACGFHSGCYPGHQKPQWSQSSIEGQYGFTARNYNHKTDRSVKWTQPEALRKRTVWEGKIQSSGS